MANKTTKQIKSYFTQSIWKKTWLEEKGVNPTGISDAVSEKNPNNLITFIYADGDEVRRMLRDYQNDQRFQEIKEIYHNTINICVKQYHKCSHE